MSRIWQAMGPPAWHFWSKRPIFSPTIDTFVVDKFYERGTTVTVTNLTALKVGLQNSTRVLINCIFNFSSLCTKVPWNNYTGKQTNFIAFFLVKTSVTQERLNQSWTFVLQVIHNGCKIALQVYLRRILGRWWAKRGEDRHFQRCTGRLMSYSIVLLNLV